MPLGIPIHDVSFRHSLSGLKNDFPYRAKANFYQGFHGKKNPVRLFSLSILTKVSSSQTLCRPIVSNCESYLLLCIHLTF